MDSSSHFAETSTIPNELMGQLPRRIRLSENGVQLAIQAAGFLVCAAAFILWAGMNSMHVEQTRAALRRDSREAIGEVSSIIKSRLDYTFTVEGRSFSGTATKPNPQKIRLQDSDTISIRYLPSNPAVNHPTAWEEPTRSIWFLSIFPTIMMLFFVQRLHCLRMDRHLVAEGTPGVAVITECSPKSNGGFAVKYEFRAKDGRVIVGRSGWDSRQEIGANICILYPLKNPQRNQRYPSKSLNYRVAQ